MILVTGGTGYIGSHTAAELIKAGYEVLIYDNLSNSNIRVLDRLHRITGVKPRFVEGDVTDRAALDRLFEGENIDAVIHFAGLKAVGESVEKPLLYYRNNVEGAICLCEAMAAHNVKRLVFSSSATVYGIPDTVPIREDAPLRAINPYGRTKLMIEDMLRDLHASDPEWSVFLLRYFNPIGAHESGLIGEDPKGIPNNLLPYVCKVAVGSLPHLNVYGNDYDTPDGTGVRDYIHVVDLAEGHVSALKRVLGGAGINCVNLGTGKGYSVLDVVRAFEKASGRRIPLVFAPRRPGDAAVCYADPSRAKALLGWQAKRDLDAMCADAWRWQSGNPEGYAEN